MIWHFCLSDLTLAHRYKRVDGVLRQVLVNAGDSVSHFPSLRRLGGNRQKLASCIVNELRRGDFKGDLTSDGIASGISMFRQSNNSATFARQLLDFESDPNQAKLLSTKAQYVMVNCHRQWGKTTMTAMASSIRQSGGGGGRRWNERSASPHPAVIGLKGAS